MKKRHLGIKCKAFIYPIQACNSLISNENKQKKLLAVILSF